MNSTSIISTLFIISVCKSTDNKLGKIMLINQPSALQMLKVATKSMLQKMRESKKMVPRKNMLLKIMIKYLKKIMILRASNPVKGAELNIVRKKVLKKSLRKKEARGTRRAARAIDTSQKRNNKIMTKEGTQISKEIMTEGTNDYKKFNYTLSELESIRHIVIVVRPLL